jgi:ATP-dependent DNA ligase
VPPHSSSLRYVDHGAGTGVELFQAVCSRDLEGIVAKPAGITRRKRPPG